MLEFPVCIAPEARRGDLQHFAHRLDPVNVTLFINERSQGGVRPPIEVRTKKALVRLRVSLSLRGSLTLRSRSLCGLTIEHACINFVLANPIVEGLRHAADIGGNGLTGGPMGRLLAAVFEHQTNSARATRVKNGLIFCSWLHLLKVWSLLKIRSDSQLSLSVSNSMGLDGFEFISLRNSDGTVFQGANSFCGHLSRPPKRIKLICDTVPWTHLIVTNL